MYLNASSNDLVLINKIYNKSYTADEIGVLVFGITDTSPFDTHFISEEGVFDIARLSVRKPIEISLGKNVVTCEIYKTEVCCPEDKARCLVMGYAFYLKNDENKWLSNLNMGLDALSVNVDFGFDAISVVCSICGASIEEGCGHIRGHVYNRKVCLDKLSEINKVYDFIGVIEFTPTKSTYNFPLAPGDTVYFLEESYHDSAEITRIEVTKDDVVFYWAQYEYGPDTTELWDEDCFSIDEIGKTVFATVEERNKARTSNI